MNIQGISTAYGNGGNTSATSASYQNFRSLRSLENGLATNNLQEAQQAYNALEPTAPHGTGPAGQAFASLGQALKSGNLDSARSDLGTVLQAEGRLHQVRVDINQIQTGLATNNLQEAQNAYSALEGVVGQRNPNGPVSQDLDTLGQDLQSGDLSSAQTAFSTYLQQLTSSSGPVTDPPSSLLSFAA